MNLYKATSLDLDGTTLNNNHEFSDRTIKILRILSNRGVLISIATGRTTASAMKYIQTLQLSQPSVPVVAFNGAYGCIMDQKTWKVTSLYCNPVPETSARQLIELAFEMGLVLQYYNGETGDVYVVPLHEEHKRLLKMYAILTAREQVVLSSYDEAITTCLSPKILILTTEPDVLIQKVKQVFPENTFHIIKGSPDPYFVEFLSPGVNKAACLANVMTKFNIDVKDVVAFGDGDNDKEMLFECGLGVAMKNAKDLAKEHANVVLRYTNHEDGVAIYLEELLENGSFM